MDAFQWLMDDERDDDCKLCFELDPAPHSRAAFKFPIFPFPSFLLPARGCRDQRAFPPVFDPDPRALLRGLRPCLSEAADHRAAVGDSPKMSRPAARLWDGWDRVKAGTDEPDPLPGMPLDLSLKPENFLCRGGGRNGRPPAQKILRAKGTRAGLFTPSLPRGGSNRSKGLKAKKMRSTEAQRGNLL